MNFDGILTVNGIEVEYTTLTTRISKNEVQVQIIPLITLKVNDVVVFISKSLFGLNHVKQDYNLVIDTVKPIDSNPLNRTAIGNSTDILDNTDVNLTVFLADIYLDKINISHNASGGTWINHTITVNGNRTYNLFISQNNLTTDDVVGWKYDALDLAGNALDTLFTFTVVNLSHQYHLHLYIESSQMQNHKNIQPPKHNLLLL